MPAVGVNQYAHSLIEIIVTDPERQTVQTGIELT